MKKVALFFSPRGGAVNHIANLLQNRSYSINIDLFSIDQVNQTNLSQYHAFIFGGSTAGADHWTNDETKSNWPFFFNALEKQKEALDGKKVALFGLGNGVLYPDHFVDEMANIKNRLRKFKVQFVGEVPAHSYSFNQSKACENNTFIGLAVDEDNEPEHSEQRVIDWLEQIESLF